MISEAGNVDSNRLLNIQSNIKSVNLSEVSFSKELAAIIAEKKKNEDVSDSKISNIALKDTEKYLKQLDNDRNILNFSDNDISSLEKALNESSESLKELLSNLKMNIMKDIKRSLLKLEENILSYNNKLSSSLLIDFQNAIQNIKDDFSKGFNISYDSVDIDDNNSKIDNVLLKKIKDKIDTLPHEITTKLELII